MKSLIILFIVSFASVTDASESFITNSEEYYPDEQVTFTAFMVQVMSGPGGIAKRQALVSVDSTDRTEFIFPCEVVGAFRKLAARTRSQQTIECVHSKPGRAEDEVFELELKRYWQTGREPEFSFNARYIGEGNEFQALVEKIFADEESQVRAVALSPQELEQDVNKSPFAFAQHMEDALLSLVGRHRTGSKITDIKGFRFRVNRELIAEIEYFHGKQGRSKTRLAPVSVDDGGDIASRKAIRRAVQLVL